MKIRSRSPLSGSPVSGSRALLGEQAELVDLLGQPFLDLAADPREEHLPQDEQRRRRRHHQQDQERDEDAGADVAEERPAAADPLGRRGRRVQWGIARFAAIRCADRLDVVASRGVGHVGTIPGGGRPGSGPGFWKGSCHPPPAAQGSPGRPARGSESRCRRTASPAGCRWRARCGAGEVGATAALHGQPRPGSGARRSVSTGPRPLSRGVGAACEMLSHRSTSIPAQRVGVVGLRGKRSRRRRASAATPTACAAIPTLDLNRVPLCRPCACRRNLAHDHETRHERRVRAFHKDERNSHARLTVLSRLRSYVCTAS